MICGKVTCYPKHSFHSISGKYEVHLFSISYHFKWNLLYDATHPFHELQISYSFLHHLARKRGKPWLGFLCPEHTQEVLHTSKERLEYLKTGLQTPLKVLFLLPLLVK